MDRSIDQQPAEAIERSMIRQINQQATASKLISSVSEDACDSIDRPIGRSRSLARPTLVSGI
jgi:hypothetical protein